MTDLKKLYNEVLYTQVRVKTDNSGGSGTIIYSEPNKEDTFSTYAITCYHVIESAITVKTDWAPPPIARDIKREFRKAISVEFFDYENVKHGHRPVSYSADADIVAYDKSHDMAVLKLRTIKKASHIAKLLPLSRETNVIVGTDVWAVGCALLHDPILTKGEVTHMGDEIDYKDYWMCNASIVFGNSGGAVFTELDEAYQFIGIPSKVDIVGWGNPVTHLGYFSPIHRVCEFFEEQMYQFLCDSKYTEESCLTTRIAKRKSEEKKLSLVLTDEEESETIIGRE